MEPLVDVLTPVYNGEEFLAEGIESVLAQTYQNWRYTIVNNCSTDRTLEIAEHYAKMDDRIRVHTNSDFLTALQNLNNTMRQLSPDSKYCKVVHADDWIYPDCIEKMVALAETNPKIGIVSSFRLEGKHVRMTGLSYTDTVFSGTEICRLHLWDGFYFFGTPTSLLLVSQIIRDRDPFYDEDDLGADASACFEILQQWDFGFVHQVLSFTREREGQETHFMRLFKADIVFQLKRLKAYGPHYLEEAQYEERLAELLDEYRLKLGRSFFDFREKAFWDYHREALKELGHPLSRTKLFFYAFLAALEILPLKNLTRYFKEKRKYGMRSGTAKWQLLGTKDPDKELAK